MAALMVENLVEMMAVKRAALKVVMKAENSAATTAVK